MECARPPTPLADNEAQYQGLREYDACRPVFPLPPNMIHSHPFYTEIMDILRIKKAHLPGPPAPSRAKNRKVGSVVVSDMNPLNSGAAGSVNDSVNENRLENEDSSSQTE